jgi:hypothetical protein
LFSGAFFALSLLKNPYLIMSIEVAFENVSIALKNLWQACLMDEEGKSLDWTQPLITSINTPRLKFLVTTTDGGAMKAYTGYELPDNISITIYETPDRKVEKYLDGWMFGPKGVFNKDTGKFRTRAAGEATNIYRCVKFSTLFWKNEDPAAGQSAGTKQKDPDVQESSANVKNKSPNVEEKSANVKNKSPKTQEFSALVMKQEVKDPYLKPIIASQQIASQLTSLVSGAANQMLDHIPAMAVGRVVIPPPLIKKPLQPSAAAPMWIKNIETSVKKVRTLEAATEELVSSIKTRKTLESGDEQEVSSIKNRETFTSGDEREETTIKKFAHRERIVCTTTYTCAIEGYEVATYDYETGGPVSYTVNLAVLNYKPEYS